MCVEPLLIYMGVLLLGLCGWLCFLVYGLFDSKGDWWQKVTLVFVVMVIPLVGYFATTILWKGFGL